MMRIILLILIFIAAALGWMTLEQYDFSIIAEFADYRLETTAARLGIVLLVLFVLFYVFMRVILWLKNSPKRLITRLKKENEESGYKNIMAGFSALAAGDFVRAQKLAEKSEKALPKEQLVSLLKAQVANISGDKDAAQKLFEDLTKTEEGQFIGYRGLISQAIAANDTQKALEIADQLLKDNPKSTWLNNALIDLGFRNSDWDRLEKYLRKAEANKSMTKEKIAEKFAVFYYMKAKIAKKEGRGEDSVWLAERALKYDEKFIPAAIFLAEVFNETGEYKKTKSLIEKFWKLQTNIELGKLYNDALSARNEKAKSKQVKKLYELSPNEIESIVLYAKSLVVDKKFDEARELTQKAQKIRETKLVCLTMAQIDDRVAWQNRAETALEDKFWHCKITGARYQEWQIYSDSGELNTIVWDYPPESAKIALGSNNFLMLG